MSGNIYSIGYTSFEINSFIDIIKEHDISCVVDVRSNPVASEYYQIYSRTSLEKILNSKNIYYRNYALEFGARQVDYSLYKEFGYLDFDRFIKTPNFLLGINKIKKGLELGYNFVLMCAEKDPINCHRAIMVAKGFKENGIIVDHIMADNLIQSQIDIEQRLLNMYFPQRGQQNLFEEKTEEDYIKEAYRIQNSKIGYKIEKVA